MRTVDQSKLRLLARTTASARSYSRQERLKSVGSLSFSRHGMHSGVSFMHLLREFGREIPRTRMWLPKFGATVAPAPANDLPPLPTETAVRPKSPELQQQLEDAAQALSISASAQPDEQEPEQQLETIPDGFVMIPPGKLVHDTPDTARLMFPYYTRETMDKYGLDRHECSHRNGNILVFDTETTGFNHRTSRMVQIAWILYSPDAQVLERHSYLIRPDGFTIPQRVVDVHHITTERALADGRPVKDVLVEFHRAFSSGVRALVAHSAVFDYNFVRMELEKAGMAEQAGEWDSVYHQAKFCTYLRLPKHGMFRGRGKLYRAFETLYPWTPVEQERLHDALYDTELCAGVFWKLHDVACFNLYQ